MNNKAKKELVNKIDKRINNINIDYIANSNYIEEIINTIKDENMYSLREKSRYGKLSTECEIKSLDDIKDFNEDE